MKITLVKRIHSCFAACSTGDRTVEIDVEMPACPNVGWFILDEVVKEIWFDGEKLNFFVEPDKTYYDVDKIYKYASLEEMDTLVTEYISKGWRER